MNIRVSIRVRGLHLVFEPWCLAFWFSQNGTYDLMVIEGFILVNMVSPEVRILSLILLSCLLLVLIDFKPVGQPFLQILRLQVDATQALFCVNAVCNVELHTGTIHTWKAGNVD